MNWNRIGIIITCALFASCFSYAENGVKSIKVRKTQEVNFSEMSLKGTIRNPEGAYLVQKRGLKFHPLYKIKEDFDKKIRETALVVN